MSRNLVIFIVAFAAVLICGPLLPGEAGHWLDRFRIHVYSDAGNYLMWFAIVEVTRRTTRFFDFDGWVGFYAPVVPALLMMAVFEYTNIDADGQAKSWFDFATHFVFFGVWPWVIYRFTPRFAKFVCDIKATKK